MNWQELHDQLAEPFDPKDVQGRAGSVSRDKKRAQALTYAEPRIYEDRLNEVLGSDWEVTFEPWGEQRPTCTLSIWLTDEAGERVSIRRSSSGEFDNSDRVAQGTVSEAQAFKRACSKFSLGRYLYDLPAAWVGYDESSSRLTEIPTLPTHAKPPPLTKAPASSVTPVRSETEPPLGPGRADAMGQRLLELGLDKKAQLELASRLLERPVAGLATLTESEALEVFSAAQKQAEGRAQAA